MTDRIVLCQIPDSSMTMILKVYSLQFAQSKKFNVDTDAELPALNWNFKKVRCNDYSWTGPQFACERSVLIRKAFAKKSHGWEYLCKDVKDYFSVHRPPNSLVFLHPPTFLQLKKMHFALLSALSLVAAAAAQNTTIVCDCFLYQGTVKFNNLFQKTIQVGGESSSPGGIFQYNPSNITASNGTVVTFKFSGK